MRELVQRTEDRLFARYVRIIVVTVIIVGGISLALNMAVDPLWYFHGNRLTGKNFAFNERISKLNRLLGEPDRYDCLIFGSSRTTLLNEKQIGGYTCYNLSFSSGHIDEFIEFAFYLQSRIVPPRLIILGVDYFNFGDTMQGDSVPDFVLKGDDPPHFLTSYLSTDALEFSLRTIFGHSPLPRYYRADFTGDILTRKLRYRPEKDWQSYDEVDPDNVDLYREFIEKFPGASYIGYVPPISAWRIERMNDAGVLDAYLEAVHKVSKHFQLFIDFSMPSDVTTRTDNTYDGSHYDLETNALIAASLNTGIPEFGIRLGGLRFDAYRERFHEALRLWLSGSIQPRPVDPERNVKGRRRPGAAPYAEPDDEMIPPERRMF